MGTKTHRRGMVHVYTGGGKGKTTAALGLALRVIGHGGKVFMLQFMKGSKNYGELKAADKYLPNLTIVQSGLETFVSKEEPAEVDIRLALEDWPWQKRWSQKTIMIWSFSMRSMSLWTLS